MGETWSKRGKLYFYFQEMFRQPSYFTLRDTPCVGDVTGGTRDGGPQVRENIRGGDLTPDLNN